MKIYLRTALKDKSVLEKIKSVLRKANHKVDCSILEVENKDDYSSPDTNNILKYDLFLIEASASNSQLGYEAAFALENNIPTVVIYNDETDSKSLFPLMALNPKTKLIIKGYKKSELEVDIRSFLTEIEDYISSRFTLNLTPQIAEFLNWISGHKKTTRSGYVRGLIEAAMKKSMEYKAYLKNK
jgi:hypothetical protein